VAIVLVAAVGAIASWRFVAADRAEELHYQRSESELVVTNPAHAPLRFFRAGSSLEEAREIGRLPASGCRPPITFSKPICRAVRSTTIKLSLGA